MSDFIQNFEDHKRRKKKKRVVDENSISNWYALGSS
jgi:hypothetical protein